MANTHTQRYDSIKRQNERIPNIYIYDTVQQIYYQNRQNVIILFIWNILWLLKNNYSFFKITAKTETHTQAKHTTKQSGNKRAKKIQKTNSASVNY